uniref:Uncharacterized protein n=1 Tax=Anopheles merus TaxID=30066 RepID=A0A182V670_ANOME
MSSTQPSRRQTLPTTILRNVGSAAVRIHTIRSSFWKPLLSLFVSSSSHSSRVHAFGRLKPRSASRRSPSGLRNLICRSDGHAISVCSSGTGVPSVCENSSNLSLNSELAMAPHGAIGTRSSSSAYANGAQSLDGMGERRPSSWSSSRDFTYRRSKWIVQAQLVPGAALISSAQLWLPVSGMQCV